MRETASTRPATPPAAAPSSGNGPQRGVAAVVLLAAVAVATMVMLLTGITAQDIIGSRDRLITVESVAGSNSANSSDPAVPLAPRGDTPGRRLGERLVLTPHFVNGHLVGYAIAPATDAVLLSAVKLRSHDVLLDVDGRPLDPARIRTLGDELSLLDRVEVTFERDGQMRKRVIDFRAHDSSSTAAH